jgi:glycosyltransferase involved in cell wall biosynthesis
MREIEREQGDVDVIHAHFYANARWLPLAHRWCSIPYVVTEHSTGWSGRNPDNQITARGFAIARRTYSQAAMVIPVSHDLQRSIEQRDIHARFTVIPNPVNSAVFAPHPSARQHTSSARLVTVSRLAPVKGHADLLAAVRTFVESGRAVHLDIVGDGPSRPEIERQIAECRLEEHVTLTGRLSPPEIAKLLQDSDVFVMASHDENLPVSVIEAVLVGIPVVATDVGGVHELLTEGMRLVPPRNPRAMVDAIAAALADLPTQEERVRRGERVRALYSFEAIGARLSEVYATSSCGTAAPGASSSRKRG